jgi:hypothetical protein
VHAPNDRFYGGRSAIPSQCRTDDIVGAGLNSSIAITFNVEGFNRCESVGAPQVAFNLSIVNICVSLNASGR